MTLHLVRERSTEQSTGGVLFVDQRFYCWTLEDVVREVVGKPVESWKVFGETAIPFGSYSVQVTYSLKFKRSLPAVMNVPGFEGIRIHRGNTAHDTEGCIIVGTNRGPDYVSESAKMEQALITLLGTGTHQLLISAA